MAHSLDDIKRLARQMILLDSYDEQDQEDLIEILVAADDLYHNDESFLTDAEYDAIRRVAEQMDSNHSYFLGIGSEVRGEAVKLPFKMGSLDQVYEGEIEQWITKHHLEQEEIIATDKLDGASCLLIYDSKGKLQIAFSRGDGLEGFDWTRHISKIPCVPKFVGRSLAVRAEVIVKKKTFQDIKSKFLRRGGKEYKNPRGMVVGLMNGSTNPIEVYQHIDVVSYEILGCLSSKRNMLLDLVDIGFLTAHSTRMVGRDINDVELTKYLNFCRDTNDYEIDGIVLDVNGHKVRQAMEAKVTKTTLNPGYAVKYKVADATNNAIATVDFVEYNTSKHGYRKPRVHLIPFELRGVTVTHSSGFNAAFIRDNCIGPGAKVRITRAGDVIPVILGVASPAKEPQMPDDINDCIWTKNQKDEDVDLVLKDAANSEVALFEQINDFFASIDAPVLREGNIQKFVDEGFNTIEKIILMSEKQMVGCVGVNGSKIYKGLRVKLNNIPMYVLMGSHSAFGRGVGVRKMKKLYTAFKGDMSKLTNEVAIDAVEGFDTKTAKKIVKGYPIFQVFLKNVKDYVTIAPYEEKVGGSMKGQFVVFTLFRDKDLHAAVEAAGGTMQSAVSGKTTILVTTDPTGNSGKLQKARDAGVKIITPDELREMLG